MIRMLVAHNPATGEVRDYIALNDAKFGSVEELNAAARAATSELKAKYNGAAIFEGADRSVQSFFRMFPNLKLGPGFDFTDKQDDLAAAQRLKSSMTLIGNGPRAPSTTPIPASAANRPDELMVATYNVENLFAAKSHAREKDAGRWAPDGAFGWTDADVAAKVQNIGRVLRATNAGRGPDVLGLVEVENQAMLERLRDDGLKGLGYATAVHADWGLGLGTALLSRLPMIGKPLLHQPDKTVRGILEVTLDTGSGPLTVFVNHWPSRSDGAEGEIKRQAMSRFARQLVDERVAKDPGCAITLLGDFNAEPTEAVMGKTGLSATLDPEEARSGRAPLYNAVGALASQVAGRPVLGTSDLSGIERRFGNQLATHQRPENGELVTFDQIFVTPSLVGGQGTLELVPGGTQIVREQFMLNRAGSPRRTLVDRDEGKVDKNAFSDHLPVVTRLRRR